MLSAVTLSVIMLSFVMLNVVMLSVVKLNVVAPLKHIHKYITGRKACVCVISFRLSQNCYFTEKKFYRIVHVLQILSSPASIVTHFVH
jgi:hypothetical protein